MFSTGPAGGYRLTPTVRNAAGRPFEVAVPACSPNGDGVKDRCTGNGHGRALNQFEPPPATATGTRRRSR